jgi:hypothetical protein
MATVAEKALELRTAINALATADAAQVTARNAWTAAQAVVVARQADVDRIQRELTTLV